MKLRIARIDSSMPMPIYETDGSVAFDIYAREESTVPSGKVGLIPTNFIVDVPDGYMLMLCSRSSTPWKKGLSTPHGFGIIDQDYCGPDDEMNVQVFNFTQEDVTIPKGNRFAQAVLVPIVKPEFEEYDPSTATSRGGFGSTG